MSGPLTNRDVLDHVAAYPGCTRQAILRRFAVAGVDRHLVDVMRLDLLERGLLRLAHGRVGPRYPAMHWCRSVPTTPRLDLPRILPGCGWCGADTKAPHLATCRLGGLREHAVDPLAAARVEMKAIRMRGAA